MAGVAWASVLLASLQVASVVRISSYIYLGGNFTQVRERATGHRFDQPFLAAFHADTG